MVNKIHDIVLADHRMKIRQISHIVNISIGRVHNYLDEKLVLRELLGRRELHLFTIH